MVPKLYKLLLCFVFAAIILCLSGCRQRLIATQDVSLVGILPELPQEQVEEPPEPPDPPEPAAASTPQESPPPSAPPKSSETQKPTESPTSPQQETAPSDSPGDGSGTQPGGTDDNDLNPGGGDGSDDADEKLPDEDAESIEANVSFDPNSGRIKSSQSKLTINTGDYYGPLPVPLREGYGFNGWFTQPEGGDQIFPESIFNVETDQILYAQWAYDPYAYWSFMLLNTTQKMYDCYQKTVYFEFESDNVTTNSCALISDTNCVNIAYAVSDLNVTDDWVNIKSPGVIIKCIDSMGSASDYYSRTSARFPASDILVISSDAVYGSAEQILYCKLHLANFLYPEWFSDVDLSLVSSELNINGEYFYE